MRRRIRTEQFESIYKSIEHLRFEQDDHRALFAMMIKFATANDQKQPWSWLNFATILYSARKNAGTRRWFYNTKDGTRLSREQLNPYLHQLLKWRDKGWIAIDKGNYDGSLSRNCSWKPLPTPNKGRPAEIYRINMDVIENWDNNPGASLFDFV